MTYIRMTGGRDRGHVKDMPFIDAQVMLQKGQALPVNFDEPDALGFRELPLDVGPYFAGLDLATKVDISGSAPPEPLPTPSAAPTVAPRKPAGAFRRGR
jgi:hypothetical protein